ncbi:MAG TPA: hypothetical protein DCE41_04590 [Cytophagales bacterium]|nr:hypothetical protein [Cytophagales bacterium]HAA23077.1 hypothetical protein [Cytophagales bacterium]HAP64277.1 hypothetical protein [Cytophagales bacterium]
MDIVETIKSKLDELAPSILDQVIEESLKSFLSGLINEHFRSYSDFGKNLRDQIGEALNISLSQENILMYNTQVRNVIMELLPPALDEQVRENLKKQIGEKLDFHPVEKIKASEIVEKFTDARSEGVVPCDDEHQGEVTARFEIIEGEYGRIRLDLGQVREGNEKFTLMVNKAGKICHLWVKDFSTDGGLRAIDTGLEAFLFNLYAQRAEVIMDDYDVEWYVEF